MKTKLRAAVGNSRGLLHGKLATQIIPYAQNFTKRQKVCGTTSPDCAAAAATIISQTKVRPSLLTRCSFDRPNSIPVQCHQQMIK
ncbi:hypothetical protein ACLB2K_041534 [Fragaria x ananassa]